LFSIAVDLFFNISRILTTSKKDAMPQQKVAITLNIKAILLWIK